MAKHVVGGLMSVSDAKPLIWVKDKADGHMLLLSSFEGDYVFIDSPEDMDGLYESYEYIDGTPCGKLEEE